MHPQEIHAPPRSLGEFVRAYAMIVLSILTALALEQVVVTYEARERAHESAVRIEAELHANTDELKRAIAANEAIVTGARALNQFLIGELAKPTPDQPAVQKRLEDAFGQTIGLIIPTWRHDAWDTAIADQSVGHLPPAKLHRFAEAYAAGGDLKDLSQLMFGAALLEQVADLQLDIKLGHAQVRPAAQLMARALVSASVVIRNQKDLAALLSGSGTTSAGAPPGPK